MPGVRSLAGSLQAITLHVTHDLHPLARLRPGPEKTDRYAQNDRNQSIILTLFARSFEVSLGAENVIIVQTKILAAATKEWNRTRAEKSDLCSFSWARKAAQR